MSDLTEVQSSQSVKIAGANPSTGVEDNYLEVDTGGRITSKMSDGTDTALITTNGDQKVVDGVRNGGAYGALTLTTAGTTYEAKVGASRLTNRKNLIITIQSTGVFWGLDSSVTSSTGQPTANGQVLNFSIDPDSTFQVWLVSTLNNKTVIITEMP